MRKIIDKINIYLASLGVEFWLHLTAVVFIATIVARTCQFTGADRLLSGFIGAFIGIVVGILKEGYDNKTTGVFSTSDIVADFIGAAFFILIYA